jgi:hypothetical protein
MIKRLELSWPTHLKVCNQRLKSMGPTMHLLNIEQPTHTQTKDEQINTSRWTTDQDAINQDPYSTRISSIFNHSSYNYIYIT